MKSDMMKYKGYRAVLGYDERDQVFVGEVFGISDSLSFHGDSIEELKTNFRNCVDNYLEFCQKNGKEPEKEFTGSFNVRISPKTHEKAAVFAAENGCSLNQVVSMAINCYLADKSQPI